LPSRPDPAGLVAEQRQRDGAVESMSNARGVVAAGDSESRASLQMLEKEFSAETLAGRNNRSMILESPTKGTGSRHTGCYRGAATFVRFPAGDGMAALSSSSNSATA
jgi:hypothetical protein